VTSHQARALIMQLRAHYTQDIPDQTILVYAKHLEHHDYDTAQIALQRFVETEQERWFPSWATIHQYILDAQLGDYPEAEEAWATLQRAIREYGAYDAPHLDALLATTVRRLGGWIAMCHAPDADHWTKQRFVETYQQAVNEARRTGHLPDTKLAGIFHSATISGELAHPLRPQLDA